MRKAHAILPTANRLNYQTKLIEIGDDNIAQADRGFATLLSLCRVLFRDSHKIPRAYDR
jgi:hypothetical protein